MPKPSRCAPSSSRPTCLDRCLIDEALAREPLDVTDDEVQHALDAMRRGRGLLSVAAFEQWMQDSGTTWQALETMATQLARTARFRERTVGHRVEQPALAVAAKCHRNAARLCDDAACCAEIEG